MALTDRDCGTGDLLACDDASDCESGMVCCMAKWTSDSTLYDCSKLPCNAGEICLPGGQCTEGFVCKESEGEPFSRCVRRDPRATCGAEVCREEKPQCCMADDQKYCVKDHCPNGEPSFSCTQKSDCDGGEFCCQFNLSATCAGDCYMGAALCRTRDDCPLFLWGQPLTGCSEGVCEYSEKD